MDFKVIATNKKAYRDFFLLEKWEAGIALSGGEVKSLRDGGVSFADSFARVDKGEIFLYNLHINPYAQASYMNTAVDRARKLLLNKREIERITAAITQKKLTFVPTRIYFNKRGFVKVEVALAQGKKLYDKREDIKRRDIDREVKRLSKPKRQ